MLPEGSVGNTYWCSASSTSLKLFCAIAVETGQQPEVIDVQTAYLEATEENDIYIEPASFSEYLDLEDHQLESLRAELLSMSDTELKEFARWTASKAFLLEEKEVDVK